MDPNTNQPQPVQSTPAESPAPRKRFRLEKIEERIVPARRFRMDKIEERIAPGQTTLPPADFGSGHSNPHSR